MGTLALDTPIETANVVIMIDFFSEVAEVMSTHQMNS